MARLHDGDGESWRWGDSEIERRSEREIVRDNGHE